MHIHAPMIMLMHEGCHTMKSSTCQNYDGIRVISSAMYGCLTARCQGRNGRKVGSAYQPFEIFRDLIDKM